MNTFIGMGNLTRNAQTRTVNVKGVPTLVTDFTVAVNEGYGDSQRTQYIKCSIWRDRGAKIAQYLTEKRAVVIRGSISASAWIDQEGKPRYQLEMSNPSVELIGKNGETTPTDEAPAEPAPDTTPFD